MTRFSIRHTVAPMFFALLSSALNGCGGGSSNIFPMSLSNGQGSITLKATQGDGEFLIIPFSAPSKESISGSASYSLEVSKQSGNSDKLNSMAKFTDTKGGAAQASLIPATALEQLRARVAYEDAQNRRFLTSVQAYDQNQARSKQSLSYTSQPGGTQENFGSSIQIFDPFAADINDKITGNLLAANSEAGIYLDSDDAGALSAGNAAAVLSTFSNISLARVHALVGAEGDINGDGGIVMFVTSKLPSGAIGVFRPIDMLPDSFDSGTRSNQREIIYLAPPDSGSGDALFHATIAHEVFHLINFSLKVLPVFLSGGSIGSVIEELFLNEGQAHAIEDLTGWGGGDTAVVVSLFLASANLASVAGSLDGAIPNCDGNDCLERRGATMLFLIYLFEQTGGANYSATNPGDLSGGGVNFFRALTNTPLQGVPNIEAASGRSFAQSLSSFGVTLHTDGTNITSDVRYQFIPMVTDSFTQGPRGFDLRGKKVTTQAGTVSFDGPALHASLSNSATVSASTTGTVFQSGVNYIHLTTAINTETTLHYETSASSSPGVMIVTLP